METQEDSIDLAKLQRDALGLVCDDSAAFFALIGLTPTSSEARTISAVSFEVYKNLQRSNEHPLQRKSRS